jgi:hypothetical protein
VDQSSHPNFDSGIVVFLYPKADVAKELTQKHFLRLEVPEIQRYPIELHLEDDNGSYHPLVLNCSLLQLGVFVQEAQFMPKTVIDEGLLFFDFLEKQGIPPILTLEVYYMFNIGQKKYKLQYAFRNFTECMKLEHSSNHTIGLTMSISFTPRIFVQDDENIQGEYNIKKNWKRVVSPLLADLSVSIKAPRTVKINSPPFTAIIGRCPDHRFTLVVEAINSHEDHVEPEIETFNLISTELINYGLLQANKVLDIHVLPINHFTPYPIEKMTVLSYRVLFQVPPLPLL